MKGGREENKKGRMEGERQPSLPSSRHVMGVRWVGE